MKFYPKWSLSQSRSQIFSQWLFLYYYKCSCWLYCTHTMECAHLWTSFQSDGPTVTCFRCGQRQWKILEIIFECPELSDEDDFEEIVPTAASAASHQVNWLIHKHWKRSIPYALLWQTSDSAASKTSCGHDHSSQVYTLYYRNNWVCILLLYLVMHVSAKECQADYIV